MKSFKDKNRRTVKKKKKNGAATLWALEEADSSNLLPWWQSLLWVILPLLNCRLLKPHSGNAETSCPDDKTSPRLLYKGPFSLSSVPFIQIVLVWIIEFGRYQPSSWFENLDSNLDLVTQDNPQALWWAVCCRDYLLWIISLCTKTRAPPQLLNSAVIR